MFLFKKESHNFVLRYNRMIQRIQSIYLLLISILSFDLFSNEETLSKLVPLLFILSAFVAIVSIFQFRKRQLQFVLGRIIILINLFLLGILIYLSLNLPGEVSSEKGIGMFIPTIVILLSVIANKAIKKDEDLVKSVDRLR